ncbi:hypothetical protein ANCCAN_06028 [Ancylostoma caninum]|uniref:Serine-threonine/tyrosine-protein kinase catalytic domain-containing protein n=1 Tax=Ancylostoma caninum TaxID=29170 RepID=A0A368GU43_ANCCA|nr:hypothetical protein ANCCAN_06028 [Ancylostoma caninum]
MPADCDSCVKMLKMDHDNINKFMGLSLDGPSIMKVWRFCERGSLQVSVELQAFGERSWKGRLTLKPQSFVT